MNLNDPVDVAAMAMYNETRKYVDALEAGETPDPTAMKWAAQAYYGVLQDHFRRGHADGKPTA